ncbi:MAG: hypothetical protein AB7E52_08225, partial [Bdellovibrionales bacterium]
LFRSRIHLFCSTRANIPSAKALGDTARAEINQQIVNEPTLKAAMDRAKKITDSLIREHKMHPSFLLGSGQVKPVEDALKSRLDHTSSLYTLNCAISSIDNFNNMPDLKFALSQWTLTLLKSAVHQGRDNIRTQNKALRSMHAAAQETTKRSIQQRRLLIVRSHAGELYKTGRIKLSKNTVRPYLLIARTNAQLSAKYDILAEHPKDPPHFYWLQYGVSRTWHSLKNVFPHRHL